MFQNYGECNNEFVNDVKEVKPIFEDVDVADLSKAEYANSVIFYSIEAHLEERLQEIISIHEYVPQKIKYQGQSVAKIILNEDESHIIFYL